LPSSREKIKFDGIEHIDIMGWSDRARGQQATTYTITLLGDPGGGKTSLKKRFIGKEFDANEKITVGADFSFHYEVADLPDIRLKICDVAGQRSFATVRKSYFTNTDAALLIFDLTNARSLANTHQWLKEFISANKHVGKPPVLLVGNKSDLELDRKVNLKQVKNFLKLLEKDQHAAGKIVGYIETSAKTGTNVKQSFLKLTDAIKDSTRS